MSTPFNHHNLTAGRVAGHFRCADCHKHTPWRSDGDMPKRCSTCTADQALKATYRLCLKCLTRKPQEAFDDQRHSAKVTCTECRARPDRHDNGKRRTLTDDERAAVPALAKAVLERAVYCRDIKRWIVYDGLRWARASSVEPNLVIRAVLRQQGAPVARRMVTAIMTELGDPPPAPEPRDHMHGSVSTYNKFGCRCDECRRAVRDVRRKFRAEGHG